MVKWHLLIKKFENKGMPYPSNFNANPSKKLHLKHAY